MNKRKRMQVGPVQRSSAKKVRVVYVSKQKTSSLAWVDAEYDFFFSPSAVSRNSSNSPGKKGYCLVSSKRLELHNV
jgi:hypothetical protein